jgi:hypothetical protein
VNRTMRTCRLLLALLGVVVLGLSTLMTASAAGPGDPDTAVIVHCVETDLGGHCQISVSIANAETDPVELRGVEVHLSFDPALVQVVDADDPANGVQLMVEDALFDGTLQVGQNLVDNAVGTIDFALAQTDGTPVFDASGAVASFEWIPIEGVEAPTDTQVTVTEALLSTPDGYLITVDEISHGAIVVRPADEEEEEGIVGTIKLQGRYDHSGTMVSALLEDPGCCQVFTDDKGYFKIIPTEAGAYRVTAWKQGYLRTRRTGVPYNPGQLTDMGTITLLGGDAVPDGVIDICDITYIASRFGGTDVLADITGDGQVNILDLTVTAANFGQSGPIPW